MIYPLKKKKQVAWSDEYSNRGYVAVERERLNPDQPVDLKEAFNVGKEVNTEKLEQKSLVKNKWLAGKEEFRETVLAFYEACTEAASNVLRAFAISLELPEDFFEASHNQQNHTMRLLHYPPIQQTPQLGQICAGEHSDYGSITLLFQGVTWRR